MKLHQKIMLSIIFIGIAYAAIQKKQSMIPEHLKNQIVLYSTTWCGYCEKTRQLFAQNNVNYTECDIEKSTVCHQQFKALGGKGVPVTYAKGVVIHGYDEARLSKISH